MKTATTLSLWQTLRRLLPYLQPYRYWVAASGVAALTNALLAVLAGYFIKTITDIVVARQPQQIPFIVFLMVAGTIWILANQWSRMM